MIIQLFLIILSTEIVFSHPRDEEPICSRFDYDEKLLAKTVRLEYAVEELVKNRNGLETRFAGKSELQEVINELERVNTKMMQLEEKLEASKEKGQKHQVTPPRHSVIAFSATLSDSISGINAGQDIVFDRAILNLGHAYYTRNGSFIAPVPGVYVLSANIDATIKSDTKIARNGEALAYLECEPWRPASQTVVDWLNRGDVISVRTVTYNNVAFYGNAFCSFSGFLLYN